jgi:hypothetical protein
VTTARPLSAAIARSRSLNTVAEQRLPRWFALLAFGVPAALLLGYFAASPSPRVILWLAVYGTFCVGVALATPPHLFIPATLVVVGVSTAFSSAVVSFGPAALYVSDIVMLLVVLRGVFPRQRDPAPHALAGAPHLLFVLFLFVLAVAGARAVVGGTPAASVVRGDLALFYWPFLYFGFTRVLAEREMNTRLLWRNLALVATGFAAYMFISRALNHTFQDPGLALVPTGPGETVPRNFGFASAFTIYPVLALAGVAGMANDRVHRLRWTLLAAVGVIATLTTLVRGEIYGLALGVLIVLVLSPRRGAAAGRSRTSIQLAVAAGVALLAVLAVDPKLGHAVIQRAVPFTGQAEEATVNADYRFKAMGAGITVARKHPVGLGVLDEAALEKHDIDPGYLVHSGFATLLILGGWVALAAAVLVLLAVVRRSFQTVSAPRWVQPAFVGTIVMLSVYSLSAAGLAGDTWVMPLGALVVALRFGLPRSAR